MGREPLEEAVARIRTLVSRRGAQGKCDSELLRAYSAQNDQIAFGAIVERHGPLVFAVCERVLHHDQDAEDAFQAVFIVLAKKAASLCKHPSLAGWLHQVGHQVALTARRAAMRRRRYESNAKMVEQVNPAWQAAWNEVQELVDEEVQRLPDKYREPFILSHLEHLSCVQVARRLGLKEGTVWSRLAEARKLLRTRLTRRGVALSAVLSATAVAPGPASASLPAGLIASTLIAATSYKGSVTTTGVVSKQVAELVRGAITGLLATKLKVGVAVVLSLSAVAGAASLYAHYPEPAAARGSGPLDKSMTKTEGQALIRRPGTDLYGDPLPVGALARFGTMRFRYAGYVQRVAFSPDGTELACVGGQGIQFWNTASDKPRLLVGEKADAMAFLAGGKQILACGDHCVVYDVADGKEVRRLPLDGQFRRSTLSPDRKQLAGVGRDGALLLVDTADGHVIERLRGHEDHLNKRPQVPEVMSVTFSPDGKWLASACVLDPRVIIWSTATRNMQYVLPGHDKPQVVIFSPDGRRLASGDDSGVIRLWDVATGRKLQELRGQADSIFALAFSPDGLALASGAGPSSFGERHAGENLATGGTVRLWNLETGHARLLPGPASRVGTIAFSPDGASLAVGGSDTRIRLIEIARAEEKNEPIGHDGRIDCIAISPDGTTLATGGNGNFIHLWDTNTSTERARLEGHQPGLRSLAFTPDGQELVSGGYDDNIRVWDWRLGQEKRSFAAKDGWRGFDLASDGNVFVFSTGELWSVVTGKQVGVIPNRERCQRAVFSPDGKRLAAQFGKTTAVLDVTTGKEFCRFTVPPSVIVDRSVFSPDGRYIMTAGSSSVRNRSTGRKGQAFVWDAATGNELRRLPQVESPIVNVAFSPDGRTLATASGSLWEYQDQSVRLWELATGKERRRFLGHRGQVSSIVFSRDGSTLFSGSVDGTAIQWGVVRALDGGLLEEKDAEVLWRDLANDDAVAAYAVIHALAARKEVSFFSGRLNPVATLNAKEVALFIKDLDNNAFPTRERAQRRLADLEELAAPALKAALKETSSAEVRRQIEMLLQEFDGKPSIKIIREIRAIEVLERIADPNARRLLAKLAKGAPEARLTQEAKAALQRLARKPTTAPTGKTS